MNSVKTVSYCVNESFIKRQRQILKVFLLERLYQLFNEIFCTKIQTDQYHFLLECYAMDGKVIQFLINGIVETGEYTLEGISYYTHIPFDVIYEAAYGISKQFSITFWARIIHLYLQVKPDIEQALINKLLEDKSKSCSAVSSLLIEI